MNRLLQFLRGAVSVAIIWGVAWAVTGVFIAPLLMALNGGTTAGVPLLEQPIWARGAIFGIVGGLNGFGFSLALALRERNRAFTDLSLARMLLWGVIGGVSWPAFYQVATLLVPGIRLPGGGWAAMVICALLGAMSASAMLAIARRARGDGPSQLRTGDATEFHAGAHQPTERAGAERTAG